MAVGLLVLRVVVGGLLIGHGTQKLFGWFGGHGIQGVGKFFEQLGYRPGWVNAVMAGMGEAGGGLLVALGLMTPLGAAAIVGVMVGTLAVHWPKGLWNSDGGFELPLVYAIAVTVIAFTGPGRYSVDAAIGWRMSGIAIGTAAAAIGALGGVVALGLRKPPRPAAVERRRAA